MNPKFEFMVRSVNPPKVELSDAGLYLRFMNNAVVDRTIIQSEWPHVAVDLDEKGNVIGIEAVPAPHGFTVGMIPSIVAEAKVGGLPKYNPADVRIENLCAA
jgi:uncharacterized protein YuzE